MSYGSNDMANVKYFLPKRVTEAHKVTDRPTPPNSFPGIITIKTYQFFATALVESRISLTKGRQLCQTVGEEA